MSDENTNRDGEWEKQNRIRIPQLKWVFRSLKCYTYEIIYIHDRVRNREERKNNSFDY